MEPASLVTVKHLILYTTFHPWASDNVTFFFTLVFFFQTIRSFFSQIQATFELHLFN